MDTKRCSSCGEEKHRTQDFPKNGRVYRATCKICHCKKQKERYHDNKPVYVAKKKAHYEANKQTYNEKAKEYREVNKDALVQKRKEHYQKNRDLILQKLQSKDYKEKRNKALKERRKNDRRFAMVCAYRARLNEVLQKQKKNTYVQYLNCKREHLLDWLEFQFDEDFAWESYGKDWVIDHVIPIDFFDINDKEHLYMCFSWFNLRPCKTSLNLRKSNDVSLETVEHHQTILNKFKQISSWYQTDVEIHQWLREKLRYGKNPSVLGNSQPSS